MGYATKKVLQNFEWKTQENNRLCKSGRKRKDNTKIGLGRTRVSTSESHSSSRGMIVPMTKIFTKRKKKFSQKQRIF